MAQPLEPEVVKSANEEKPGKKRRSQVRFKIRSLPPAVHRELDERLGSGDYRSLAALSEWLEKDHGQFISPSSLAYYLKHQVDPTLQAVKLATAQAAEIARECAGDDDQMSLALVRLVQTAIFDLLVYLNRSRYLLAMIPAAEHRSAAILATRSRHRAENGTPEPEGSEDPQVSFKPPNRLELAAIAALGKTVATVSRANIELKRWREHVAEKLARTIAVTGERVSEAAREGGLSPAAEQKIRAALMEIKL